MRIAAPILALVASLIIVGGITLGLAKALGASDDGAAAIASVVASGALLAIGLWIRRQLPRHERGYVTAVRTNWAITILVGIGVALGLRFAIGALTLLSQELDSGLCKEFVKYSTDVVPPEMWHKVFLAVSLVIFAPFGEELVFRGLLLRGLARTMPFLLAATVSGLIFGLAHTQYFRLWPALIGVAGFGFVVAFVYRKFGYPGAVAAHMAFNVIAAVALFIEFDAPDPKNCE